MKFSASLCLLVALVALLSSSSVKADEIVEPLTFEIGQRVAGDQLLDLYYDESDETAVRTTHSVTIDWAYRNINFIRLYVYSDATEAVYQHTGLPESAGSITVTVENVQQLVVLAYLYGTEEMQQV